MIEQFLFDTMTVHSRHHLDDQIIDTIFIPLHMFKSFEAELVAKTIYTDSRKYLGASGHIIKREEKRIVYNDIYIRPSSENNLVIQYRKPLTDSERVRVAKEALEKLSGSSFMAREALDKINKR